MSTDKHGFLRPLGRLYGFQNTSPFGESAKAGKKTLSVAVLSVFIRNTIHQSSPSLRKILVRLLNDTSNLLFAIWLVRSGPVLRCEIRGHSICSQLRQVAQNRLPCLHIPCLLSSCPHYFAPKYFASHFSADIFLPFGSGFARLGASVVELHEFGFRLQKSSTRQRAHFRGPAAHPHFCSLKAALLRIQVAAV
jgi:hypothetical protein